MPGSAASERVEAGVEGILVGRAEVPEAQHLAGRAAATALDDVAGGEHRAPQLVGVGALRHRDRRDERARRSSGE